MDTCNEVTTKLEQPGYDVLFVGLVCFLNKRNGKRVLLPDGRTPGPNVTPHYAYLAVDPEAIVDWRGWFPADETENDLMESGLFRLPKCRISMTGTNTMSGLDTARHAGFLPSLRQVDPNAAIDPDDAEAVVDMMLTSGTLEAYRVAGVDTDPDDDDVAVISRLRVPEYGPITITIEPLDGGRKKTLTLKRQTSVAVANIAFPDEGTGLEHFSIFAKLIKNRQLNGRPLRPPQRPPAIQPVHPLFSLGISIIDGQTACGNNGCC